jgi:flagellar basal body rod protein FlgG
LSGAPAPAPTTEELGRVPAGSSEDPKTAARYINLKDVAGPLSFTEEGEVYAGTDLIAKLSIAEFADTRKLRKMGAQYFENWDPTNLVAGGSAKTIVRQGMLETSNVNPIEEMTNLIKANRLYEHDMKAIKTYSDILQREANDIGKL